MFGSAILEVAIGIVFIYLFLSLICTFLMELFASVMHKRAKYLQEGIRSILNDPNGDGLIKSFYKHPLIEGIVHGHSGEKGAVHPSYISPRVFALAVLDIVSPADGKEPRNINQLRAAIDRLQYEGLKKTLLILLDEAEGDIQKFKRELEKWFDDGMERVGGWYKRWSQKISVIAAFLIVIILNVDTIDIAKTLYRDSALRSGLVAAAQETVKLRDNVTTSGMLEKINDNMSAIQFPLGWKEYALPRNETCLNNLAWLANKACGFIITACAVSLGAPFWFDILNKIINLRSGGNKPERAKSKTQ